MTSKINKLKPANQVNNQAAPSNGKEHFTLSEDEFSQAGDGITIDRLLDIEGYKLCTAVQKLIKSNFINIVLKIHVSSNMNEVFLSVNVPSHNNDSSSCLYILRSYAMCNIICGVSTNRNIKKYAM